MLRVPRYYGTEAEFEREVHERLGQMQCPWCGREGTLILHGVVKGYTDTADGKRVVKGHRLYCNERRVRQSGCGKTVSIGKLPHMKGFWITAVSLWRYLSALSAGENKAAAFRSLELKHVASGAYRLIARLRQAQVHIRGVLESHITAPSPPEEADSVWATIRHLRLCFPDSSNPILSFKRHFQVSFLSP